MILFFGLLRPYKGIDTLLRGLPPRSRAPSCGSSATRAWTSSRCARLAAEAPGRVRFLTRFVEDAEIPAIFRRADLVVLPYRDAEHSGVLYTGLAFGKPMVLSAVGGFPELAEHGAARLVPPEDPAALAAALAELVGDEAARAELAAAAPRRPPPAPTPGTRSPRQTLALYRGAARSRRAGDRRSPKSRLLASAPALIVYTHARLPAGAAGAASRLRRHPTLEPGHLGASRRASP